MSELPPYNYVRTINTKTNEVKYFTPSFIKTRTFQASDYKIHDQIPDDPALVRPLPTTMGGHKEQKKETVSDDKIQDIVAQAVAAALASDRARIAELEAQLKAKPKKQKDNG